MAAARSVLWRGRTALSSLRPVGLSRSPPGLGVWRPPLFPRRFQSSKGDNDPPDGSSLSPPIFYPDSWVEPEALWEFKEETQEKWDVDDEFAMEFGERNERWRQRMLKE